MGAGGAKNRGSKRVVEARGKAPPRRSQHEALARAHARGGQAPPPHAIRLPAAARGATCALARRTRRAAPRAAMGSHAGVTRPYARGWTRAHADWLLGTALHRPYADLLRTGAGGGCGVTAVLLCAPTAVMRAKCIKARREAAASSRVTSGRFSTASPSASSSTVK
ncbi:hypothetical protein FGB62_61g184 [Gracilaria domingensis]|nr:hypothetical protein FGB62_61g184 [Gracilaria domingensis]